MAQALVRVAARRNSIVNDSNSSQLALLGSQALRRTRVIKQQEDCNHGHTDSRNTLHNKQPAPAGNAVGVV